MKLTSTQRVTKWLAPLATMCAVTLFSPMLRAGSVSGTYHEVTAGSTIDLTAEGTLDWIKFGNGEDGTDSFLNTTKIGNPVFLPATLDLVGTAPDGYTLDYLTFTGEGNLNFTWGDGNFGMYNDPGPVDTLVTEQLLSGAPSYPFGFGLTFDALAGADTRVMNVYVQGFNSDMLITASMSGGGSDSVVVSPTQVGTSDPNNDYSFGYYQITYSGSGETLTVTVNSQSPATDGQDAAYPNAALFAATVISVPEPATFALLALGGLLLIWRRRR